MFDAALHGVKPCFLALERSKLDNGLSKRVAKLLRNKPVDSFAVSGEPTSYQKKIRELAAQLLLTEERERREIASDLHDRVGQALSLAKLKLMAYRRIADPAGHHPELSEAIELINQSISDTRNLIFDISPPVLYKLGLRAAIEWYAEKLSDQYGIDLSVSGPDALVELETSLAVLLYRTVRELLLNVVKHAKAEVAEVHIECQAKRIRIDVCDNGCGFAAQQEEGVTCNDSNNGFGLFSIQERLAYMGGSLTIDSSSGSGTCASVVFDLP